MHVLLGALVNSSPNQAGVGVRVELLQDGKNKRERHKEWKGRKGENQREQQEEGKLTFFLVSQGKQVNFLSLSQIYIC